MALDTVGAVRDRDAVALDLPVERIPADLGERIDAALPHGTVNGLVLSDNDNP